MKEYRKGIVSVIIPVYNASEYLERCFKSILCQSFKNFEIIFVDDCSTDSTSDKIISFIEDEKELDMKYIRHDSNRGVAAARNTGLDNMTGEYVYYLDADDYMEKDTLELLYSEVKKTGADIVGCEWFLSFKENERPMHQPTVNSGEELFVKMCRGVMRWNLWLFLVKSSLYVDNGFRFTEGMNMGEDMMVMMKLALSAGKVSIINKPLYHYVQTKSDSLTRSWSRGYRDQISFNVYEVQKFVSEIYSKRFDMELNFLKLNIKLPLLISDKEDDYRRWLEWFPDSNDYIMQNKDLSLRIRLLQFAASKHKFVFLKLYYYFVIRLVYGVLYK